MQRKTDPVITGSPCGRYRYHCRWQHYEDLPLLGIITSRPSMGPWETDKELLWAMQLAHSLDYGGISMAYASPECSQFGFRQREMGAPQAQRELCAKGILTMIDESSAVVCAWGAYHGGAQALQFILAERPHTWLYHMGLSNGNPKRVRDVSPKTRLTRWRV